MNVYSFDLEPLLVLTITNLVCRVVMATLLGFYTIIEIPPQSLRQLWDPQLDSEEQAA